MVWGVFPMNWLRSKAKKLSLLALFALALQLGLSFGHVHHDRAFAGTATISDQASAASRDNSNSDTDGRQDLCAICATVAMANALIDSTPPVLPVPVETTASDIFRPSAARSASAHLLGFQSRAPPQS